MITIGFFSLNDVDYADGIFSLICSNVILDRKMWEITLPADVYENYKSLIPTHVK